MAVTQPIDVAYVQIEAKTDRFDSGLRRDVEEAMRAINRLVQAALATVEREFEQTAHVAGDAFKDVGDDVDKAMTEVVASTEKAGEGLDKLGEDADKAGEGLDKLGEDADKTGEDFDGLGEDADKAGKQIADAFKEAGRSVADAGDKMSAAVTVPLVGIGAAALKMGGDFEASMNQVRAVTGATGDAIMTLENLAKDLGATTAFSASEAADAMYFLAASGFNVEQIISTLPGVLNLASAGAMDLASAADIASNILSGYAMKADQLGRVNDVLVKTFQSTNVNVQMIGESMKYIAPVAAAAGMKFEQVTAAIGLLGNAGIQGSEAGTALRGSLVRLMAPTAQVSDTLDRLGVTVTNAAGDLLPLDVIVRQLEKSGASTADMMTIFGQEAGPAMLALVSQGSGALTDLTKKLRDSAGTAAEVATIQMQGFNASLANLESAFEGLMIALADAGLLEWVGALVLKVTEWVSAMSETNPAMLRTITIVAAVVAAIGPVLSIVGRLTIAFGMVSGAITKMVTAVKAMNLAFLTNPVFLVVAAIVALGVAMVIAYNKSETFRQIVDNAFRAVGQAAMWLWDNALKPAFDAIGAAAVWVGRQAVVLWNGYIKPAFAAIGAVAVWLWRTVLVPAFDGIVVAVQAAAVVLSWWWQNVTRPVFEAVGAVAVWLWRTVLVPAFDGIVAAFKIVGAIIGWLWSTVVQPVFTFIGALAMWLWQNVITPAFNAIATAIRWVGGIISWLWTNVVKPAFTAIRDHIVNSINNVVRVADLIKGFVSRVREFFGQAVSAVKSRISAVVDTVKGLPGRIKSALGNLGNLLTQAGRNVLQGLIDGIMSKLGRLREIANQIASTIRNNLPFSPAKEGPLSGAGNPSIAGQRIAGMLAAGIDSRLSQVIAAADRLAGAASLDVTGRGTFASTVDAATFQARTPDGPAGVTVMFEPGAITIRFEGVVPTEDEARRTGQAVGDGIVESLTRRDIRSTVRRI